MATRNIVPRADGEGNIGSSVKNWLSGFFKTINILGAAIMTQIITPANPSAGTNKLYFKSDNKLYKLTSAGSESEVGTGSGSGIPIATAAGTADAITADYTPDVALTNLTLVAFVATAANSTTTPTFSPDGLTTHTITKRGGIALVAGDIPAALAVCIVEYNLANTRWELLNPSSAKSIDDGTYSATAINIADAVTKKHVQSHSIVSTADHTSAATSGQILKADANGLPINATNTDADVASAVSLKHTNLSVRGTFTNASLSAGVLTVTHSWGLSSPYQVNVVIVDNNLKVILPNQITCATNSAAIDLSSYGSLVGTWGYLILG